MADDKIRDFIRPSVEEIIDEYDFQENLGDIDIVGETELREMLNEMLDEATADYVTREEVEQMIAESETGGVDREAILTEVHGELNALREEITVLVAEEVSAQLEEYEDDGGFGDGGFGEGGFGDPSEGDIDDRMARLDELITRAEEALRKLELVTGITGEEWTAGPESFGTDDSYHTNGLWGVHFETEEDIYLRAAQIDSLASGTLTFRLYEFTGGDLGEVVAEKEVTATGRVQNIDLEMLTGPGEYLLTRPVPESRSEVGEARQDLPDQAFLPDDDAVSLRRRASYEGWDEDSQHAVNFIGGDNPSFGANDYWYYFASLEVVSNPSEEVIAE